MNIHEYQVKKILKSYDIEIPDFKVVTSLNQTVPILDEFEIFSGVVKVPVHT